MHLVSSTDVVCWHLEDTRAFYASILLLNIIAASESENCLCPIINISYLVNSPHEHTGRGDDTALEAIGIMPDSLY